MQQVLVSHLRTRQARHASFDEATRPLIAHALRPPVAYITLVRSPLQREISIFWKLRLRCQRRTPPHAQLRLRLSLRDSLRGGMTQGARLVSAKASCTAIVLLCRYAGVFENARHTSPGGTPPRMLQHVFAHKEAHAKALEDMRAAQLRDPGEYKHSRQSPSPSPSAPC